MCRLLICARSVCSHGVGSVVGSEVTKVDLAHNLLLLSRLSLLVSEVVVLLGKGRCTDAFLLLDTFSGGLLPLIGHLFPHFKLFR